MSRWAIESVVVFVVQDESDAVRGHAHQDLLWGSAAFLKVVLHGVVHVQLVPGLKSN